MGNVNIHITVVIVGQMYGAVSRTDANLDRVMSVIGRLLVVTEYYCLPGSTRKLAPGQVDIQRLICVASERAVEDGILPAVEGCYGILLKCVPVQDAPSATRISSQNRYTRLAELHDLGTRLVRVTLGRIGS